MKDSYDFSKGRRANYAERMRKEGFSITVHQKDGSSSTRTFPPGVMPSRAPSVHVYPTRNGWAVRSEVATRAYRTFKSQEEAIRVGIQVASKAGSELVVHPKRSLAVGGRA